MKAEISNITVPWSSLEPLTHGRNNHAIIAVIYNPFIREW